VAVKTICPGTGHEEIHMKNTLFKGRHHGSNPENLDGVASRLTKIKKCLLVACTLGCVAISGSASALLYVVDGIDTPDDGLFGDDYSTSFTLDTTLSSGGTASLNVSVGRGDDLSIQENNLFILFEIPTDLIDLTFGDNTSPGWEGLTGILEHPHCTGCVHAVGSENLIFELDGDRVEIKMKPMPGKKGGNTDAYDFGYEDKDGEHSSVSTSLDYNIQKGYITKPPGNDVTIDSPGGAACKDESATASDAACYSSIESIEPLYQYAHIYEFEFADFFTGDKSSLALASVADYLENVSAHMSFPKRCTGNVTYNFGGDTNLEGKGCDSTPEVPVPEPSAIFLFGIGLAGLGFGFGRRKAKA
jgi:hypothetical protein